MARSFQPAPRLTDPAAYGTLGPGIGCASVTSDVELHQPARQAMNSARRQAEPSAAKARLAATSAGLRYLVDEVRGIRRVRRGSRFVYVSPGGRTIRDAAVLARIRSLVIPPAWTAVWISPWPSSHLQATGRDARGRKQYKYHVRWRTTRDAAKFDSLLRFAGVLPTIRRRANHDLAQRGLPRSKVLAAVVRLLEVTLIRVGNDEYAEQNHSFGLTTMRDRHVRVHGSAVRFHFRGKSGVEREIDLDSPQLARIVRHCQELPGQELFQYIDSRGNVRDIGSTDVNAYLRALSGEEISAKDFRTWAGSTLALRLLRDADDFTSITQGKRTVAEAIARVATRLGNTKSVCRKCYVHPAVIEAYLDHSLHSRLRTLPRQARHGLKADEAALVVLLRSSRRATA